MNNIEDKTEKSCTGCGACISICPVSAIEYKINENGFYQTYVNKEKCIKCGICKKVCIKFQENEELKEIVKGKTVSAQSKNKENLIKCTSGGIAFEISKYGIENGYKVVGTIYDYKENIAKTIIAENYEQLDLLRGSKYIQSNTAEAYKKIIDLCKDDINNKFMIFGTPCQIDGISRVIKEKKLKNEVLTIDLFCHGVPSYLVWKKYLKFLNEEKNIKNINSLVFRDKNLGWHKYYLKVKDHNGNEYIGCSRTDIFYKAFLDNILLNDSCQTCLYRKKYTNADIRLGDFWGKRYSNREDGVSAVVCNSEKGENLLNLLIDLDRIEVIEKLSTEECLEAQSTDDYGQQKLRKDAFEKLKEDKKLKKIISSYRIKMPIKKQIKYVAKEIISLIQKI